MVLTQYNPLIPFARGNEGGAAHATGYATCASSQVQTPAHIVAPFLVGCARKNWRYSNISEVPPHEFFNHTSARLGQLVTFTKQQTPPSMMKAEQYVEGGSARSGIYVYIPNDYLYIVYSQRHISAR